MSAQSLLQQIDQECQGLSYEALLKKAKDPIPFNGGYTYPHEAARARALPILDKAIALEPNKAKAYAMKGEMIYETFLEGQFPSYTPLTVNKESYLAAYDNIHKAWTLEPNQRDYVRKMRYMFNPPFEFYCPGKLTSIKQHLTDDQVNLVAKVIVDTYTYTETDQKISDKFDLFKEVYDLVLTILLVYTNKDLLNFKINLTKFLITYDTQTNPGGYEVDQAASFLDLGEDEKGKSVYQDLLAREPNFRFSANDSIFKDPYKSIEHHLQENMIFLMNFIKMDPTYPYSYYTVGRIIEVHFPHETAKAIEYYSKAESLIKDEIFTWQSDCLCRLARILSIDGKFQQALIAINKAQSIEPSNPKIGLEKGRILKSCGQVTLAFFEFERAQKLVVEVGKKVKEDSAKVSEAILKEKEELLRYFGSKIMQDQVDKVKETLDYDSVAQMKKDMAKIQTNQALKDYYDQFVFAFSSLYGTSQVVISGQLALDTSNTWLDLGAKALSLLPFYGDTIESIFSAINGQLIGADMKKKAQLFCLLAVNQSELDSTVSYIARKIVLNSIKRRRIVKLGSNKQDKETVSEFWEKINKFYAKFKSVAGFEDYKLRSNTPAAKLALKDTATLISRIIKNEALLKKTSEERSDEIVELFFDMEEEALEKEAETKINITNIIPVQTTAGRFGGCFGGSAKRK